MRSLPRAEQGALGSPFGAAEECLLTALLHEMRAFVRGAARA